MKSLMLNEIYILAWALWGARELSSTSIHPAHRSAKLVSQYIHGL